MKTDILFKVKSETLFLIKDEAEKNLLAVQSTEDVITNKSNNLIQIIIPVVIVLSGFIINGFSTNVFDWKFYLSGSFVVLFSIVVFKLYKNILPVKTSLIGSEPKQLVQSDMIIGQKETDERNILVNRVYNLQNAIDYSLLSHSKRYNRFKSSIKLLLLGMLIILSLFLVYQAFVLFQDMY